ncbi:hypothetical protein IGI49_001570 [Enterococcus sp. AZ071]
MRMNKSIEIEYKTMLTQQEYLQLMTHYQLDSSNLVTQTNLYFDTSDYQLKEKNMGLRIRYFDSEAEATLKIPQQIGLLEVTDSLELSDVKKALKDNRFPKNAFQIISALNNESVTTDLLGLIGRLVTKRAEKIIPEGKLALDESWYRDQHDFELELEVQDSGKKEEDFFALLKQFNIPYRPAENKIVRAVTVRK